MNTTTKKDLVDLVAQETGYKRMVVKKIVQDFLDGIVKELGKGNRLEFRDFGVFEVRSRAARTAQNPKTLERVEVPPKQTVRFKPGRMMKMCLDEEQCLDSFSADGLVVESKISEHELTKMESSVVS